MEKAILKTLIYADLFDYPLSIREIHRWLISKNTEPRQIEKALKRKNLGGKILNKAGYFFLKGRDNLVRKRKEKQKYSYLYIRKIKVVATLLKIIPFIKLVGLSGGLAMENAGKGDDIDLFIITKKGRLWISRLLILMLISLIGQRRGRGDTKKEAAGKICCNIILEEDKLEQSRKDLYTAHEVLQMKVLWQRDGIYSKFLAENDWAFKYLPNWITQERLKISDFRLKKKLSIISHQSSINFMEKLAMRFQLKLMKEPKGMERIQDGAVYFHPEDYRAKVLDQYKRKINSLGTS